MSSSRATSACLMKLPKKEQMEEQMEEQMQYFLPSFLPSFLEHACLRMPPLAHMFGSLLG